MTLASGEAWSQAFSENKDKLSVRYEDRLQFYVDKISRDYLIEMAASEGMLLQSIRNISAEIRARGSRVIARDDARFGPLYDNLETMISEYDREVRKLTRLIADIDALKRALEREERHTSVDEANALRDSLSRALERRNLNRLLPVTKRDRVDLMQEYQIEVDSLISFYGSLSRMERQLDKSKDQALLERIAAQKRKIGAYLQIAADDSLAKFFDDAYVEEANKLVEMLGELSEIQKRTLEDDPELLSEIDAVKRDILSRVDNRFAELTGHRSAYGPAGPTLSTVFEEWRAARMAIYEIKAAEYKVMKSALLESGTPEERERMYQRDRTDALLNYVDKKYDLAENQFARILEEYSTYRTGFEDILFYKGEAQYARLHYEQAFATYEKLLDTEMSGEYRPELYLRLITIAQTRDWKSRFYRFYNGFVRQEENFDARIRDRLHFLAGYYMLSKNDTRTTEAALDKISPDSRYSLPATYLSAIAAARRNDYSTASARLERVIEAKSMPWSKASLPLLRNNALLRLGYIEYEQGRYEDALKRFEQVSRGIENRDDVLIGQAWTEMKRGNLDETVGHVDELFQRFLSSDHTYEALVLAAHCKQLLSLSSEALQDLRYVSTARGVLDLTDAYHEERRRMLEQLDELERMEDVALDVQDQHLYSLVTKVRANLQSRLLGLGFDGSMGSHLLSDFDRERQRIYRQIRELDTVIRNARQVGNSKVESDAKSRRGRLVQALIKYQSENARDDMNIFLNFPLAARESNDKVRRNVIQDLIRQMEVEKQRIRRDLFSAQQLIKGAPETREYVDLAVLKTDLQSLEDRIDRFQTWLKSYEMDAVESNFDHWADFSGFGMSDITFRELDDRESQIQAYSSHLVSIEGLMRKRRSELENRLGRFDGEIDRIRKELEAESLRLRKLENDKIFNELYFDTSTSEVREKSAGSN